MNPRATALPILLACSRRKPTRAKFAAVAQKSEFKRLHPCPATGARIGPCGGYVIDHVIPLACGGPDVPSNMQWQTVAEGKAKDRWELKACRQRR